MPKDKNQNTEDDFDQIDDENVPPEHTEDDALDPKDHIITDDELYEQNLIYNYVDLQDDDGQTNGR